MMVRIKRHLVVGETIVCLENSHPFVGTELTEQWLWLCPKQTFKYYWGVWQFSQGSSRWKQNLLALCVLWKKGNEWYLIFISHLSSWRIQKHSASHEWKWLLPLLKYGQQGWNMPTLLTSETGTAAQQLRKRGEMGRCKSKCKIIIC